MSTRIRNSIFNLSEGSISGGSYWTPQSGAIMSKLLFWGLSSEISGGQMPNKVTDATDYLTVAGSAGAETYQLPNTAPYIAADTDYLFFREDATARVVTTLDLISYDFTRVFVKYDNSSPYAIREIIILKGGEVLSESELNNLLTYTEQSIWWSNLLSRYGVKKGNRDYEKSVWYFMLLTSTGTGVGVSTLSMQVSSNITVTLDANAKFYSDAGGTLNESATWTITSGALRTIYLKCTAGSALATFSNILKVTNWGTVSPSTKGWVSGTNAASITAILSSILNLEQIYIEDIAYLSGAPPVGLLRLKLCWLVNWIYSGAMPAGLIELYLDNSGVRWTYNGAMPTGLRSLYLGGFNTNWTGLDVSGSGNISTFVLGNYRIAKMSSIDMITLLTSMTNRVGTLPTTVMINDYADYASPPAEVTAAVATLKAAKSITTVTLGA